MRVLLFSTAYLPHIGGAELAIKEITDRLPEIEFDLITAKLKRGLADFERMGNVNVYRLGAGNILLDKPLLPNLGFLKAINLHKQKRYDLIHGVMASQGSAAAYLFKFFYPKLPFILTLQEGDLGRNSSFDRFWQKRVIKKADIITAISSYLADYAKRFNKKAPVYLVPNGAVISPDIALRYRGSSIDKVNRNNKYQVISNKEGNKKLIITVSRLVRKNGIDILIKAVKELKINDWELRIIGDGPERKKLEKLAEKSGIADRVKFLGSIPNEEIPGHLAGADVFVRPSRSEGLGIAFLEAMAAGVPIIGTAVGGIPDFLKDPSIGSGQATGLFCKMEDPKDLAEKIGKLLKDENLSRELSENGLKLIEEKYNWNGIAQEIKKIYVETINRHTGI